jgi:hypothetical protein
VALRTEWVDVEDGGEGWSVGPLLRFFAAQSPQILVVGIPAEIEAEARWGDFSYYRLAARGSGRGDIGKLRLAAISDVTVTSSGTPLDSRPALGDQHAMPGFRWGEERGTLRAVAGFDAAYPTPVGGYLKLRLRAGAAQDSFDDVRNTDTWVSGFELGAFWPTLLGLLSVSGGMNSHGERRFYLDLGQPF